jgi:hypothetical protein
MKIIPKLLRYTAILAVFVACHVCLIGCQPEDTPKPPPEFVDKNPRKQYLSSSSIAVNWLSLSLEAAKLAQPNSPTYSSRAYAYVGLVMYESLQWSDEKFVSMAPSLNGLKIKSYPQTDSLYRFDLVLNAGVFEVLNALYPHSEKGHIANRKYLYDSYLSTVRGEEGIAITNRSDKLGKAIANDILDWARNDGGHDGYLNIFPKDLSIQPERGKWYPPVVGQVGLNFVTAMTPNWGENRTFLKEDELPIPAIIPFSDDPASKCHADFMKTHAYTFDNLTEEQKEMAEWWADDPTATPSPPGHSMNLASIAIKQTNANLMKATQAYALVGMAVADGFINCWKAKYKYWSMRPLAYINHFRGFFNYWPEPPFPAFYSGHSVQSEACAVVLEGLFGKNFEFTDTTNEFYSARLQRKLKPRKFKNFKESSDEASISRIYGGIHTFQDIEIGQQEGRKIGLNVLNIDSVVK